MNCLVTFTQFHEYEIEAKNENEALEKAKSEFYNDMCRPIADTHYDDIEIRCEEE